MRIRQITIAALLAPTLLLAATGCSSTTSTNGSVPGATVEGSPSGSDDVVDAEAMTDQAVRIVDAHFDAYDAGDIDAMFDLVAADAEVVLHDEIDVPLDEWRQIHEWKLTEGTRMLPRGCVAEPDDDVTLVVCEYGQHEFLSRAVDGPVVPTTTTFTVGADGIVAIGQTFGPPDFLVYAVPFSAWMEAHHPADAEAVGCCGWESVADAREKGALVAEYAEMWAAWLEAHPNCTWRDEACQSDAA